MQKRLFSPAWPLQVSSQALVIAVVHTCMLLPTHVFPLHVLPKTRVGLFSFVFFGFVFPQGFPDCAFKGNFENVIGQNERKISSDLFPI